MLCHFRANLCGIAVYCLLATEYEVELAQMFYSSSQSQAGCQSITAAQNAVAQQNAVISAHSDCFLQNIGCLGQAHGQYCYLSAFLILQAQCYLQCLTVIGIHNIFYTRTV